MIIAVIILVSALGACTEESDNSKKSIQNKGREIEESQRSLDGIEFEQIKDSLESVKSLGAPLKIERKMLLVSSGQMSPYTDIHIRGVQFKLVQNENGDTTYLSTESVRFETPEGYKVDDKWKVISKSDREKVERMPGWGYFIKLNSGWQLGFCEGATCTDHEPTSESEIRWIFKRK